MYEKFENSEKCTIAACVVQHSLFISLNSRRTHWTSAPLSGKLETTDVWQYTTGRLHERLYKDFSAVKPSKCGDVFPSPSIDVLFFFFFNKWLFRRSRHCCNRCRTSSRLCRTRSSEGISLSKTLNMAENVVFDWCTQLMTIFIIPLITR